MSDPTSSADGPAPIGPATAAVPSVDVARIPREIWVLIVAAFVIAIGFGLITPVLPAYARSFDVGVTAATIVVSAFAFMRLVFAPAGGALITRLGERWVYLVGLLIVAASSAATAFAANYWQLLVFRGLGGIGSTMFTVSAMALIVRLAPPTIRGKVSSAYGSAFLIGNIAGPILGGFLARLGMQVPFLVYAAALVIATAIVATQLSHASLQPPPGSAPKPAMTVREALDDSAYRAALVSGFANGWANFGVRVALTPLFIAAALGDDPRLPGIALALFAAGNAGGLMLAGRRSDLLGRRPLILTGLAISAVATAAFGFLHSFPLIVVASLIGGAGAGVLNPAQQASLADVVGNERGGGKVLAAFQMAQDTGTIFGPIVTGMVVDAFGYAPAFILAGVVAAIAFVAWLPARETLHRAPAA
ncbi:MAG: MFS transporter [Micrococcales bacterium]|nr:MFS transporter [Micrococcales bacterium]